VVGAGIIGLTTAFALRRQGHLVTVVDPAIGRGATWAAAGMLAPVSEFAPGESENFQLQASAVAQWHSLRQSLISAGEAPITVAETGTLHVAFDAGDRRLLSQFVAVATETRATLVPVSRSEYPEYFHGINDRIHDGVFIPGEAWVNPNEIVEALTNSLHRLGTTFLPYAVTACADSPNGPELRINGEPERFDAVVFCTGAAPTVSGVTSPPVRPIRGTTVRVRGFDRSGLPMVRSFVRGRPFYFVGRDQGYGVLGASAEEKVSPDVEVGELQRLLRDALDTLPGLETASVEEYRVGHRPVSPSGQPFFDEHPTEGWASSNGHYRHGVTLAPLAASWAVSFVERVTR